MKYIWQNLSESGFWDKTGALVSWLCAVHCLLMPLAVSSLPLAGLAFFAHEGFEYLFIAASVFIASISILSDFFRFHRNIRTVVLFGGGLGLMIFADRLFEESAAGRTIFVFAGAAFITGAHFLNRYLCRKCRECGENGCRSST